MKGKSPKTVVLSVIAAAAIALTACTSSGVTAPDGSANTPSSLDQVLSSKVLRVGVQTEVSPWGVLNADGSREGFDIDLAEALAASLGAEVEYVNASNETRIPLLQTDKVDVVIASFTITAERAQAVEFSIPYAATGSVIVVPKESTIRSYSDLEGRSVATSRGSTGEVIMDQVFPQANAVKFESFADSLQALRSNKAEALVETTVVAGQLVEAEPQFKILEGDVIRPALMAIGVKRGDSAWLNYINTFIRNWNVSGGNEDTSQKWLKTSMADFLK